MYTIDDFLNGNIIINCRTEREAEELFEILRRYDVKWKDFSSLYNTCFYNYHEKTAYRCSKYEYDNSYRLSYKYTDFYQEEFTKIPIVPYQTMSFNLDKSSITSDLLKLLNGG